jgi:hypothetical protein
MLSLVLARNHTSEVYKQSLSRQHGPRGQVKSQRMIIGVVKLDYGLKNIVSITGRVSRFRRRPEKSKGPKDGGKDIVESAVYPNVIRFLWNEMQEGPLGHFAAYK